MFVMVAALCAGAAWAREALGESEVRAVRARVGAWWGGAILSRSPAGDKHTHTHTHILEAQGCSLERFHPGTCS